MNNEEKNLLKRTLRKVEENQKILQKIRRSMFLKNIMTLFYWAILIGIPIILYYYVLDPYIAQLSDTYNGLRDAISQVSEQVPVLKGFLNNIDQAEG